MVDGQLTSDCNYIVKVWSHQFVWFPWFTMNFRFFEDKYMNICLGIHVWIIYHVFYWRGIYHIVLQMPIFHRPFHFSNHLNSSKKTAFVHLKSPMFEKNTFFFHYNIHIFSVGFAIMFTTDWWFGTLFLFFHILGISSSQLTNSIIFQRARAQPPTRYSNFRWYLYIHL